MSHAYELRSRTIALRRSASVMSLVAALCACEESDVRDVGDGGNLGDAATGTLSSAAMTGSAAVGWCGVKEILDRACISCHANPPLNGAPLALTNYAELAMVSPLSPDQKVYESVVATVRASRSTLGRYAPMPPTAALPPSEIEQIERWVAQGAAAGTSACVP